jgi:hypothetical protein
MPVVSATWEVEARGLFEIKGLLEPKCSKPCLKKRKKQTKIMVETMALINNSANIYLISARF